MKALGIVLIVIGVVMLGVGGMTAAQAPNVSYAVGAMLPGLLFLIVGLKTMEKKKPAAPPPGEADDD